MKTRNVTRSLQDPPTILTIYQGWRNIGAATLPFNPPT